MSNTQCTGCKGGLHCYNEKSPCFMQWCGIYPGTGPCPSHEEREDRSPSSTD